MPARPLLFGTFFTSHSTVSQASVVSSTKDDQVIRSARKCGQSFRSARSNFHRMALLFQETRRHLLIDDVILGQQDAQWPSGCRSNRAARWRSEERRVGKECRS